MRANVIWRGVCQRIEEIQVFGEGGGRQVPQPRQYLRALSLRVRQARGRQSGIPIPISIPIQNPNPGNLGNFVTTPTSS